MPKKPLPQFIALIQASSRKEPFDSPNWIFQTKVDGFRAIAVIDSTGKARLWSGNQLPLEAKLPTIGDAVNQLNLRSTIFDGEIVALDENGRPRFQFAATVAEATDCSSGLLSAHYGNELEEVGKRLGFLYRSSQRTGRLPCSRTPDR
jgi:ATP-dependent DNA ligase